MYQELVSATETYKTGWEGSRQCSGRGPSIEAQRLKTFSPRGLLFIEDLKDVRNKAWSYLGKSISGRGNSRFLRPEHTWCAQPQAGGWREGDWGGGRVGEDAVSEVMGAAMWCWGLWLSLDQMSSQEGSWKGSGTFWCVQKAPSGGSVKEKL